MNTSKRDLVGTVNHYSRAIELHQSNRSQSMHFVGDLPEIDVTSLIGDQPMEMLWGSPACEHVSKEFTR